MEWLCWHILQCRIYVFAHVHPIIQHLNHLCSYLLDHVCQFLSNELLQYDHICCDVHVCLGFWYSWSCCCCRLLSDWAFPCMTSLPTLRNHVKCNFVLCRNWVNANVLTASLTSAEVKRALRQCEVWAQCIHAHRYQDAILQLPHNQTPLQPRPFTTIQQQQAFVCSTHHPSTPVPFDVVPPFPHSPCHPVVCHSIHSLNLPMCPSFFLWSLDNALVKFNMCCPPGGPKLFLTTAIAFQNFPCLAPMYPATLWCAIKPVLNSQTVFSDVQTGCCLLSLSLRSDGFFLTSETTFFLQTTDARYVVRRLRQ